MAKKIINAQMKQRRDTKANWAANNPVLLAGELGIVSDDPNLYKVGDGTTAWNALPFRGFDGTLVQELGTSPNAVISQKVVSEKFTELEPSFSLFPKELSPNEEKWGVLDIAKCKAVITTTRVYLYAIKIDYRDTIIVKKSGAYKYGIQYANDDKTLYNAVLNDSGWITDDSFKSQMTFKNNDNLYARFNFEKADGTAITLEEVINNFTVIIRNEERLKMLHDIAALDESIYPANSNNPVKFIEIKNAGTDRVYYIGGRVRYDDRLHIITTGNMALRYAIQQCKAPSLNYDDVIHDSGWLQISDYTGILVDDADIGGLYVNVVVSKIDDSPITTEEAKTFIKEINLISNTDHLSSVVLSLQSAHVATSEYVAHRGVHVNEIPENSLDAYIIAGRCRFEWGEADIMRTSDGHYVLMHDDTINRTMVNADNTEIASSVYVQNSTLQELRRYLLRSDVARYRTQIPTYEEYLLTCKKAGIKPLIELKSLDVNDIPYIISAARRIVGENFALTGGAYAMDLVRSLDEKVQLWYLTTFDDISQINSVTGKPRTQGNVVWYPANSGEGLSSESVNVMHQKGVPVAVWLANAENIDELSEMGVDIFAGDYMCPNLKSPKKITSDINFTQFAHSGQELDGQLYLSSGQFVQLSNADRGWLPGFKLILKYKGNITISGAHGYTFNDSSDYIKARLIQGLVIWGDVVFRIDANEDTIINYIGVEYEDM